MTIKSYTHSEVLVLSNTLPEHGPICDHCGQHIPQFQDLAITDEKRILSLSSSNRSIMAMKELIAATGCSVLWAKLWVAHRGRAQPDPHNTRACPYCGKPLRTSLSKQCRYCFYDWHDSDNIKLLKP